jgi:hypothetical protein
LIVALFCGLPSFYPRKLGPLCLHLPHVSSKNFSKTDASQEEDTPLTDYQKVYLLIVG